MTTIIDTSSKAPATMTARITELDMDLVGAVDRRWLDDLDDDDDGDGDDDWRDEVASCCGGRLWTCAHYGHGWVA